MPLTSKNCCIKVSNSDQIFISSKANCGVEQAFENYRKEAMMMCLQNIGICQNIGDKILEYAKILEIRMNWWPSYDR